MSPLVPPLSQQCYTCQSCCWRTSSVSLWSSAVSVGRQHRVNGVTGVLQGFLQLHQQPLQTQTHHITSFLIRRFSPLFSPLFLKCSSVDYSDNSTPQSPAPPPCTPPAHPPWHIPQFQRHLLDIYKHKVLFFCLYLIFLSLNCAFLLLFVINLFFLNNFSI